MRKCEGTCNNPRELIKFEECEYCNSIAYHKESIIKKVEGDETL